MALAGPRPVVSYVATLFNKRAFLPYVIAGLAAQTGDFDRQYIFVDDGSSDDTVDVLRDLVAGADAALASARDLGRLS